MFQAIIGYIYFLSQECVKSVNKNFNEFTLKISAHSN